MIWREELSAASAAIAWRDAFFQKKERFFFQKKTASRHAFEADRRKHGVTDAALTSKHCQSMLSDLARGVERRECSDSVTRRCLLRCFGSQMRDPGGRLKFPIPLGRGRKVLDQGELGER